VFFAKNAASALKLGQARGAVILTAAIHGLSFHEYSPTEVKAAITGHGGADKAQVAQMVRIHLGPLQFGTFDASDALALALCHAQRLRLSPQKGLLSLKRTAPRRSGKSLAESLGITAKRELK
jgi:crossover junction endodeoxyribonuclease RuvC